MRCLLLLPLLLLPACSSKTGDGAIAADPARGADGGATSKVDPPSLAKAGAQSGSRLKTRWLTGEDGSKVAIGTRDSKREEDCGFQRAADGRMRCLPAGAAYTSVWYADSACKDVLAYTAKGKCDAPKYASEAQEAVGCEPAGARLRAIRGRFVAAQVYVKSGAACTAAPMSTYATSYDFYSIGAEITPDQFVAATETFGE